MNFAPVYVIYRAIERVFDFCHHWYVDGSVWFVHNFINFLEERDRTFAVRVTLKYFFQPLYKDYSIIGRILGVIFRSLRILIGVAFYLLSGILFLAVYLAWTLSPIILLIYASSIFFR
ncbi:MAG TPA: hypothetical protein VJL32_03050 [Candidatus Paceibacterota bacterium]